MTKQANLLETLRTLEKTASNIIGKVKDFFPKTELPVMFMLIAMTIIGIIYNIYTANNPEKPYLCPTHHRKET